MVSPINPGGSESILGSLRQNRSNAQNSISRIASGQQSSFSQNSSSSALAAQLRSEIETLSQASSNIQSGNNLLQSAGGGIDAISQLTQRGREISIQAANGTLSSEQRDALGQELQSITSEIDRISQSTEFNDQSLLDGSLAPDSSQRLDIQTGSNSGDSINLNVVSGTSSQDLGLDNLDLSSSESSLQAAESFSQAENSLNAIQGQIGATSNRLQSTANSLSQRTEGLSQTISNLTGTNIPEEITNLRSNLSQIQASLSALGTQNNQNEATVGRLLNIHNSLLNLLN